MQYFTQHYYSLNTITLLDQDIKKCVMPQKEILYVHLHQFKGPNESDTTSYLFDSPDIWSVEKNKNVLVRNCLCTDKKEMHLGCSTGGVVTHEAYETDH